MTKRVLVSLLLLALALCLSVTSYALLQNRIAKLGQALENAVYTDLPAAQSCQAVLTCSKETLPLFRVLVVHGELDALTSQLRELPLLQNDPARYRQTCLRCLSLLHELAEGQKIRADTVF